MGRIWGKGGDFECRFDVVSIVLNSNKEEIKHIKNAFYPEV